MTYNNPQGRIEGFGVDQRQARFTGTFEISELDDEAMSLDRVVVMLVAARSTKIEHSITDAGDVVARRVLKVSDAMPLTGEMRDQAIAKMSSHMDPNQGVFEWGTSPAPISPPSPGLEIPANLDSETGELTGVDPGYRAAYDAARDEVFVPPAPQVLDGPQVVGVTRTQRRDPMLEKFLTEDYG